MTNEKQLLHRAGLRGVDEIVAALRPEAQTPTRAVSETEAVFAAAG